MTGSGWVAFRPTRESRSRKEQVSDMESSYPKFVQGQTLTADALNAILGLARPLATNIGINVGFGISWGYAGAIQAGRLVFGSGAALDQFGRPLNLAEPPVVLLPAGALEPPGIEPDQGVDAPPEFDFVDPAVPGYSVVLAIHEAKMPHSEVCEDGCTQHAELWTFAPRMHVVRGRLRPGGAGTPDDPILGFGFVSVTIGGAVLGSASDIVRAVDRLLSGSLDQVQRDTLLNRVPFAANELPGVKAYKAGVANDLLVAARDYARLAQYLDAVVRRVTSATPGVAVGWLEPALAGWTWHPRWRHGWVPSEGLLAAIFGGDVGNLLAPHIARIKAILDNFSPPQPAPAVPPKGPFVKWNPDLQFLYPRRPPMPKLRERVKIPPERIPEFEKLIPIPDEEWWKQPPREWVVELQDLVGRKAELVQPALERDLVEQGFKSRVEQMTIEQAAKLAGAETAFLADPADRLVLVTDSAGLVVNTVRVPATFAASELPGVVDSVGTLGADLRGELAASLATFEQGFKVQQAQVAEAVAGFDVRVTGAEARADDLVLALLSGPNLTHTVPGRSVPDLGEPGRVEPIMIDRGRTEIIAKALEHVEETVRRIAEERQVELPEEFHVRQREAITALRESREIGPVEIALRTVRDSLKHLGAGADDLTRLGKSIAELGRLGGGG